MEKERMEIEKKASFREKCKKIVQALRTLDLSLSQIETLLLFLLLAILILAEVAGSVLREMYQSNLAWIEQLLKYVVIWIGMVGASLATQSKEHISIEIVSRFSSARAKRFLSIFLPMFSCLVAFALARASYEYIQDDYRTYLTKSRQSGYLTFENIILYQCPDESNQKRESFDLISGQAIGYIEWLHEGLLFPDKKLPYPASYIQQEIQNHLSRREKLSRWNLEWLDAQWENKWKNESSIAWESQGKKIWEEKKESALLPDDRIDWQAKWMSQKWNKEGKQQCEEAWRSKGIQEWSEVSLDSDLNEEEFQEEWKYNWTKNVWKNTWSQEMESDWKGIGGSQECFRKAWQKKWLKEKWQGQWRTEWENILHLHRKIYIKPGNCPCCSQKLLGKPWQVPRWIFLMILPVGFYIIAFRFFLQSLESIFIPELGEEKNGEAGIA